MLLKRVVFIMLLLVVFTCSDDSGKESIDIDISDIMIYLVSDDLQNKLVDNEVIVGLNKIDVSSLNDLGVLSVKIFIDGNLESEFNQFPFSFSFNTQNYSDGEHIFKLEVETISDKILSKSIKIIIDNTGPVFQSISIAPGEMICSDLTVDCEISELGKVEVFLDDKFIVDFDDMSNFGFTLDPSNYSIGKKYLKFLMTDKVGNTSKDSININIKQKLVSINFPDNFTRKGTDQVHIILSDSNGGYLQSQTHSDISETIYLCAPDVFENNTKYTLTFVEDFDDQLFNFFIYSDLTKGIVGEEITFQPRPNNLTNSILDISIPFYELNYVVKASGAGYSMINWKDNKTLSGHYTTSYNDNLGSSKVFVHYYNEKISNSYKWAFIENITSVSVINAEDMSSNNVVHKKLGIGGTFDKPHLTMYGFENDTFYNDINGHLIYENPSLEGFDNVYNYSYANIFNNMFFSISASNYVFQGVGDPPNGLTVPRESIDYDFLNNSISFSGLSGFEVGRVRLSNSDLEKINVEFVFNGESSEISVPQLPEGLFSNNITDVFNNGGLNKIQAVSEDYSNYNSYGDYISNVLVNSTPFYITSEERQRVFKSTVNPFVPFLLPIREFPYFQVF